MIRRLLIPLLGAGLLLAGTTGSAFAKCENPDAAARCEDVLASVEFGGTGTIHAGSETPVTIGVSRGERPFEATSVALVFTHLADETVVSVEARASGEPGTWLAEVELPAGGVWSLAAWVDGVAVRKDVELLRIREPVTPPVTPTTPVLPIVLGFAGLAAAGLAWQTLRARRRAGAGVAAPVRSAATADQT
jgi:hypothetical protein